MKLEDLKFIKRSQLHKKEIVEWIKKRYNHLFSIN